VIGKYTRLNVNVGKGAVIPKYVYRYPAPASATETGYSPPQVRRFPAKEEFIASQKFSDKELRKYQSAFDSRQEDLPNDPAIDPRNHYHFNFDTLPPYVPIQSFSMRELAWNEEGFLVPLKKGENLKRGEVSYWSTDVSKKDEDK